MAKIDEIVKEEWQQFQHVNNEGGRADCQDNWQEFNLNRKSQFMSWTDEILESYYKDLMRAKAEGRNLIFEKYAFMMKETAPGQYEKLKDYLPKLSEKKKKLIEEIVEIQSDWAEDFARRYPAYAGNGRPVHASETASYLTSVETYLRGELCSYGEETVELYAEYVKECAKNGKNLTDVVRGNIARLHGYESVEDVEKKLLGT